MHILKIELHNFRGIRLGKLVLPQQVALIGPNGAGKSTVVDALSLVFGRTKLVQELTAARLTGGLDANLSP